MISQLTRKTTILLALIVTILTLAACSSGSSGPAPVATAVTNAPEYSGIIASSEFVVGENRFPFGLVSENGTLLENAQVQVRFYLLAQDSTELRGEAQARFREIRGVTPHQHADGEIHEHLEVRGAYIVDKVIFDTPGFWGADFVATTEGRRFEIPQRAFEVKEKSIVPNVGDVVPPSRNLTLADVEDIEEIETRIPPDNMHELSVAQALELGKPFVVVFATPMFCVTRMCGPVTDIAAAMHDSYGDRVNFIHIEPWDLKVARGEGRLVPIDIVSDWNLPTEPWVFVVDEDGRVADRFEGLVSTEELEAAILGVLDGSAGGGTG